MFVPSSFRVIAGHICSFTVRVCTYCKATLSGFGAGSRCFVWRILRLHLSRNANCRRPVMGSYVGELFAIRQLLTSHFIYLYCHHKITVCKLIMRSWWIAYASHIVRRGNRGSRGNRGILVVYRGGRAPSRAGLREVPVVL